MRKRGEIESLFYHPTYEEPGSCYPIEIEQWRRNLELEVALDIRGLLKDLLDLFEREGT